MCPVVCVFSFASHFDGVRALAFHPVEPVLLTASEDHTLKLWNLQKTVPSKKTASLDVEPIYTFRGHTGPILCLAMSATGETCYSGSLDSTIRCWGIPNSNIDPYDSFDPSVEQGLLAAHTDAVWGLCIHSSNSQLLSCSADGTVRLWSPTNKTPLLNTFWIEDEEGVPTSVDFVRCEPSQMVAAYTSCHTYIYDVETSKQVIKLDTKQTNDVSRASQVNRVVSHPTLPLTITAHEDRHIRFFDNHTGKMVHSMVAHLEAVTSLAVDPNGLYLLSGSHDCSIRLWNLDGKTCVQEITSHRKKCDEAIHDVAFHPSKPHTEKVHNYNHTEKVHNYSHTEKVHNYSHTEKVHNYNHTEKVHNYNHTEKVHNYNHTEKVHNYNHTEKVHNYNHTEKVHNYNHTEKVHNYNHTEKVHNYNHTEKVHNYSHTEKVHNYNHTEKVHNYNHTEKVHNYNHTEKVHNYNHTEKKDKRMTKTDIGGLCEERFSKEIEETGGVDSSKKVLEMKKGKKIND
ncbi:Striatin-3 [Lamellibrachia satsuma]|nr:Striatin-3 [Lamellibrachia satsuma]